MAIISSNGNLPFSSQPMIFELNSSPNVRPIHRSAFFVAMVEGNSYLLTPFCDTDAPDSGFNINDNRFHADAPISDRLCIQFRHVRGA